MKQKLKNALIASLYKKWPKKQTFFYLNPFILMYSYIETFDLQVISVRFYE